MATNQKKFEREHPGEAAKRAEEAQQAAKKAASRKLLLKWGIPAIALVCALVVALILVINANNQSTAKTAALESPQYVAIDVQDYGTITAELYPDIAPITVANFLKLVDEKFYDGLTFHRIISGFMIQGGDPNGNGTGGSSETIKGEFSSNGVENNLLHTRGVLSMARSNDPDSASSQFFIMHADASHLDGEYAAFGKVIDGLEIVDAICEKTPVTDGNGTVEKENQPVITSIRRIEAPASASQAQP